jgi:hypothetical protein
MSQDHSSIYWRALLRSRVVFVLIPLVMVVSRIGQALSVRSSRPNHGIIAYYSSVSSCLFVCLRRKFASRAT